MIRFHNHDYVLLDYQLDNGHTRVLRYAPEDSVLANGFVCQDCADNKISVGHAEQIMDCVERVAALTVKTKPKRSLVDLFCELCRGK